ncbi:phosphatase PAP2 family protein [Modestobacter sp. SSW1-42]|uniref:phosphatase PAP2 family protein n=1 Tax=Modestobacter sp. SSW1-42 TaxID=596372 RepID=UPI003987A66D
MARSGASRPLTRPGDAAAPVTGTGRPPWWLLGAAAVVLVAVTVDLLAGGVLEALDLRVSTVVDRWDLRDSAAYWPVWVFTQAGGRGTVLVLLAALVAWTAVRRRTYVPALRIVVALVLLTAVVYAFKWGTGRTAPEYPGSFFHRGGGSYPSGHVANAALMWGVARWQAVEFGLPPWVQRACWLLAVVGPFVTGVTMVALNFHWVTDVVAGLAVGVLLLGVVHAIDALPVSRWARARAGRQQG